MICLLIPRVIGYNLVPEPPARMIPRMGVEGTLDPMRWVVTGAGGMLGTDVVDLLADRGHDVLALTRATLDVTDPAACLRAIEDADAVVNAAAWTDVDGAEADEMSAFAVNAVGAANVARACATHGARLVHLSTDYVFPGTGSTPYRVDDPVNPINAYGRGKAAGEWAVRALYPEALVVRTAWLYGYHGPSFVATMLRLAREGRPVDVVTDQRGQPTWTRDLAGYLHDLLVDDPAAGIRHGTSTGECTWFDLAREVFVLAGCDADLVRPSSSAQYRRPAARPAYSVLANDGRLPDWRAAVRQSVAGWPA
jgi:dTDP-4-dehydrorhamnose reductase